jgi:hypothetical protein
MPIPAWMKISRFRASVVAALLLAVACVGLGVLAVSRRGQQARPAAASAAPANRPVYVSRGRLWPQLREALRVLGDRLEKPGKERLTLTGTLSRANDEQLPVRLILEYPDKLRLEEPDGVTVYDGQELRSSKRNLGKKDEDEIESLLSDSAEHFFVGQTQGLATRFLGSRFRTDDGTTPGYRGPFFDLYQVYDRVALRKASSHQPKLYYLNSDSLLVERVRYESADTKARVEVQLTEWQKVGGQFMPGRVVKLENGVTVLSLSVASATVGPRVDDSIFTLR